MIKNLQDYLAKKIEAHNNGNAELDEELSKYEKKKIKPRIGDWMTTYTGGMFWLLDPRPEEVFIEDIAHALSLICRYNGHIKGFYSVAQHSVIVSQQCKEEDALFGLLHDAAEAYTGDIISPLKRLLPNYKAIEERIINAVCSKYSIRVTKRRKQEVKYWDNVLLATEVRDLIPHKYLNWKFEAPPLESPIKTLWGPKTAEKHFLKRFKELYGKSTK